MYYAQMYVGEGATMASEAAILGTPSVYINPLILGYLNEINNKYHLLLQFSKGEPAITKVLELAENQNLKKWISHQAWTWCLTKKSM